MHLLCPRLQRQDRTEPGSQEIIPGQPSLPGNRQDLWGLQGLRDRSRCSAEAWWRRFAGKYAVAVAFVGARKGPDRIAPHSGYNCSACLTGRTSCSLATTLGCSTPEGRLGTPRYQARELLIGIILRSRAASRERASNPIRRRSSRSAEGDAAAGWPIRNTGDPNSDGGRPGARYQRAARQHSSCIPCRIPGACLDSSLRIAGASHPDAAAGQDAGKVRSAILGPGPTSHSSASILYFCAASQGACDFQADSRTVHLKCSMRSRIYCSPTLLWCMRNCGKAAPQLRGDSGGPVEQYPPICARSCAREGKRLGSGRRDLVKPLCHLLGFRVSGNPTSSSWQTHLVLAADW